MNATTREAGCRIHFVMPPGCIESANVGGGCIVSAIDRVSRRIAPSGRTTSTTPPWGRPVAFNPPRLFFGIISPPRQSRRGRQKKHKMKKGKKQLTGVQRCRIEFGLATGESERMIAKEIGVSLSMVSREIRKHTYESFKGVLRAHEPVRPQAGRQAHRSVRRLPGKGRAVG